uniref:Uncharacterized protein n=3 Tax=Caenorhabditis japonica TaxID=281687 RepID=A0A8R1IMJ9_CAEJA
LDSEVLFIDYCEVISTIVAFTRDGFIFHLTKGSAEGRCAERVKVKLGGKSDDYRMQLNDGMLVMSYGAREVRIWDLVREENGTLALEANKGFVVDEETINVVTVNGKRGVITAATSRNNIAEWKRRRQDAHIETAWQLSPCTHLDSPISLIRWSPVLSTCAVITDDTLVLFGENNASVKMRGKVAAIQTSSNSFTLLNAATGVSQDLKLTIPSARGISLGEKQLVVWSDDTGTLRQEISLPKSEGDPEMLEINKNWMAVATTNGFIRIYNLNSRDAQQEHNSKYVVENLKNFYKFHTIKINQTGNKVAVTYLEDVSTVAELLLVFDAETDSISSFSFDKGMTDTQEYEAQAELAHTSHGRPVTAAARKM